LLGIYSKISKSDDESTKEFLESIDQLDSKKYIVFTRSQVNSPSPNFLNIYIRSKIMMIHIYLFI